MRRPACGFVVAALLLAGCGATRTGSKAPAAASPSTATTQPSTTSAHLTSAEAARLNAGIDAFNRDSKSDPSNAAMDATQEAGTLTELAAKHIGTSLSTLLVQASDDWTKLSSAILASNQQALNAAEHSIGAADGKLGVGH